VARRYKAAWQRSGFVLPKAYFVLKGHKARSKAATSGLDKVYHPGHRQSLLVWSLVDVPRTLRKV
jgi:hypothetical protein